MRHCFKLAMGVATAALSLTPCFAQRATLDVDKIANWPAPLYWQRPAPSGQADISGRIAPGVEKPQVEQAQINEAAVFVAMTPCRLVDTRGNGFTGLFGPPSMTGGSTRVFPVPSGSCSLPGTAVAYSFNIAVVPSPAGSPMRWLTAWPDGDTQPTIATLNDKAGLVTSNAAIVAAGNAGAIDVYVEDATDVILDVNGYYALPANLPFAGSAGAPALTFGSTNTGLYSAGTGEVGIAAGGNNVATVSSSGLSVPGNLDFGGMITYGGSPFIQNPTGPGLAVGLGARPGSVGNNTALGYWALGRITNGQVNTGVGSGAGEGIISGYDNVAVGTGALAGPIPIGTGAIAENTAVGTGALGSLGTGENNTALGYGAGANAASGSFNTFVGNSAAGNYQATAPATGSYNTFLGNDAGYYATSGSNNTLIGNNAGYGNASAAPMSGGNNTFVGNDAGYNVTSGVHDTFLGNNAGYNVTTGSDDILIGNQGNAADANLIRIGTTGEHTATFIAGIRGVTPGVSGPLPVVIDSNGQLGTTSSSRRFKTDIADMGDTTETLMSLRPVQFRYTAYGAGAPLQYGLIAEEVAEVAPELVAHDANGEIQTVYYDKVNAMLLKLVQEQQRTIEKLEARVANLESGR
ncbi:MAG: tail fiber domain-containing protein [Bryobacteraceae bacterium]